MKEKEYKILALTKAAKEGVAWLLKAVAKDKVRPVLARLFHQTKTSEAVAADGFRMHIVTPSPLKGICRKSGMVLVEKLSPEFALVKNDKCEGTFPDYKQILPTRRPVFKFGVNPKYLIDALSGIDDMAVISLYSPTAPFLVEGFIDKDKGYAAKAMVMPMYLKDAIPTSKEENDAKRQRDAAVMAEKQQ